MNIKTNQQPIVDYETFKSNLREHVQSQMSRSVNFIEIESDRINETSEGMLLRLGDEKVAPLIYPQKLYEAYCAGIPLSTIAANVADIVKNTHEYPKIPDLSPENAQKYIWFSLINKDWNQKLLATCPYKEVLDLAAVPRWFTDSGAFLVNNMFLEILGMTADKVMGIARRNTESERYVCRGIDSMIFGSTVAKDMDSDLLDKLYPAENSQLSVLTSQTGIDGSRAVLSDRFMQKTAQKLGADKLCLIPSSRDEMLAADIATVDIAKLKRLVSSVNCDPRAVQPKNVLSNSVYCYNAKTHALSILQ